MPLNLPAGSLLGKRSRNLRLKQSSGQVVTYTFQPDGTVGIDTSISEANPDTVNPTGTAIAVRTPVSGANRQYPLIKFTELTSVIPAGATMISGVFSIWNTTVPGALYTFAVARILVANAAWTEADATWNYAVATTTRWAGDAGGNGGTDAGCSVSGTDYSATDLGTGSLANASPSGTGIAFTLSAAELQAMYLANYGLHMRQTNTGSALNMRSSDHATTTTRPKLVVTASIP